MRTGTVVTGAVVRAGGTGMTTADPNRMARQDRRIGPESGATAVGTGMSAATTEDLSTAAGVTDPPFRSIAPGPAGESRLGANPLLLVA